MIASGRERRAIDADICRRDIKRGDARRKHMGLLMLRQGDLGRILNRELLELGGYRTARRRINIVRSAVLVAAFGRSSLRCQALPTNSVVVLRVSGGSDSKSIWF